MDSNDEIGKDIVISFHEQFAQNQNHHQKLFLQILGVILTVLIGFGYVYIRIGTSDNAINITIETIYAFLCLSMFLLSLAVALIVNMALGFRRDQLVACNIRVITGVMNTNDNNNFFPSKFNPVEQKHWFFWMPEFYQIFFASLILLKLLLIGSVLLNSQTQLCIQFNVSAINFLITFSVSFVLISFFIDVIVLRWYFKKWKKYCDEAPEKLKNSNNAQQ